MSATLIQRHYKNHSFSRTRDELKFYRLSFHDCINTIYQFIKPFLDNEMSIFEEYGAFKRKSPHCILDSIGLDRCSSLKYLIVLRCQPRVSG